MLSGKTVLLGVTGSIAAYKAASLASALKKQQADVHVLMTKNAANFIHPLTFESLTGNKCISDTFDRQFEYQVNHISLAKRADLLLVAPASANIIAKFAHGLADDMLTTTALACRCPKILSPAMNTRMFENPLVQENLQTLRAHQWTVVEPAEGHLACGDTGAGKMPEPETLLQYALQAIACQKDMQGLKVLVTAGATQEPLDPVRYLTNHSSGKMGYALARQASLRGAEVTLVTGKTSLPPVPFVDRIPVVTAEEMWEAVTARQAQQDILVKAAAVADYRPQTVSKEKIKKSEDTLSLSFVRNPDILQYLGQHRLPGQYICGFAMETEHVLERARQKLLRKGADMIVANSLRQEGAGFETDTNQVTILTKEKEISLPLLSKAETASRIWDAILQERKK